jgi:hypothetical protein
VTVTSDAPVRGAAAGARQRRVATAAAIAVGAVVVMGVVLRFTARSELWLDEALTVNVARLPLGDLPDALRRDGAPPLHYVLLHGWMEVFGSGDVAVRALSGVCAVLALAAIWCAGRRVAGRSGAWVALAVLAANPYAIRYATEARMYALEVLLVCVGIVAVRRALDRPALGRLVAVAGLSAALVLTHYWALSLVAVTGMVLAWRAFGSTDPAERRAAKRTVGALVAGAATFAVWLPVFLDQRAHTGTPWGAPVLPGLPVGETLLAFAGDEHQEGWLALPLLVALVVLGVFGARAAGTRVDLDLRGRSAARGEAIVGGATLVVAASLAYVGGTTFQPRYSALVLPFFVLLVARGITVVADERVRAGLLAAVVLLGLVGGVRAATERRTQADEVAAVLRAEAVAGDVVAYCPDQLGPAVHRIAPDGLDEVVYPDLGAPAFVDWVDYEERVAAGDPAAFAREVLARAGDRTVWLVAAGGYRTHVGTCERVSAELGRARPVVGRVAPDEEILEEPAGLEQFPSP